MNVFQKQKCKQTYLPTKYYLVTEYSRLFNCLFQFSSYRISWPSLTLVYRMVGHYHWPMILVFPTTTALMIAKAIASAK